MWVTFGGLGRDEVGWGRKISGGDYQFCIVKGNFICCERENPVALAWGVCQDPEVWDKNCVKEFPNLQAAINYSVDLTGENAESLRERIERCFPRHVRTNPRHIKNP